MVHVLPRPPHLCPCGCGDQIPYHKLACPSGWYLLPQPLRHRITGGGAGRLTAVGEALTWYRENVRDGAPLPASTRDGATMPDQVPKIAGGGVSGG